MRLEQARLSLEAFNADRRREVGTGVVRIRRGNDPREPLEEVRLEEDPGQRGAWVAEVLTAKRENIRELQGFGVLAWRDEVIARGASEAAEDPEAKRMYEEAVRLDHALAEMWGLLLEEEEKLASAARAGVEKELRHRLITPVRLPEDDVMSRDAG